MSGLEWLAVASAGFGAGVLTSTVGVASLLSFPILVAVGLPPVMANTSNTIGLVPAGVGGAIGYRRELREQPSLTRQVIWLTGAAGAVGAVVLLVLPQSVFEAVIPWLILGTCGLVGVQPRLSRWLAARRAARAGDGPPPAARLRLSPATRALVLLTGVYGGYFGAGAGVMMIAVLALALDVDLKVISAIRTTSVMAANVVAGLVFAFVADVDWAVVGVLAAASVGGGYLGARVARRMPARVLRALVVLAGVVAALTLIW